jgi:transcriptional regulator with XRE-family HTH domain
VAGAQIRAFRMRAGLTLDALGKRLGLTRQGVQRIEAGEVASSIDRYEEIARALGVPLRDLLPDKRRRRRAA